MNNTNLPPFYVGQKVIALKDQKDGDFKKGSIHTVFGINKCNQCGVWAIDIGKYEPIDTNVYIAGSWISECHNCDERVIFRTNCTINWYWVALFAPVQENFQSISLEKVLEKETPLIGVN